MSMLHQWHQLRKLVLLKVGFVVVLKLVIIIAMARQGTCKAC